MNNNRDFIFKRFHHVLYFLSSEKKTSKQLLFFCFKYSNTDKVFVLCVLIVGNNMKHRLTIKFRYQSSRVLFANLLEPISARGCGSYPRRARETPSPSHTGRITDGSPPGHADVYVQTVRFCARSHVHLPYSCKRFRRTNRFTRENSSETVSMAYNFTLTRF